MSQPCDVVTQKANVVKKKIANEHSPFSFGNISSVWMTICLFLVWYFRYDFRSCISKQMTPVSYCLFVQLSGYGSTESYFYTVVSYQPYLQTIISGIVFAPCLFDKVPSSAFIELLQLILFQ